MGSAQLFAQGLLTPFWVILSEYTHLLQSSESQFVHICHLVDLLDPLGGFERTENFSSFPSFFSIPSFLSPFHLGKSLWGNLKALLQNIQVCFPSGNAWASFRRHPTCCETGRLPVFVSDGFQFESRIEWFSELLNEKKESVHFVIN